MGFSDKATEIFPVFLIPINNPFAIQKDNLYLFTLTEIKEGLSPLRVAEDIVSIPEPVCPDKKHPNTRETFLRTMGRPSISVILGSEERGGVTLKEKERKKKKGNDFLHAFSPT